MRPGTRWRPTWPSVGRKAILLQGARIALADGPYSLPNGRPSLQWALR